MPRAGLYVDFTNNKTGKSYSMPWDDPTRAPSRADKERFAASQDNEGWYQRLSRKAFTPLTDVVSRNIKEHISEPLLQYSEGQPLKLFGRDMAGGIKDSAPKGSWTRSLQDFDRSVARYGGGFAESLGEQLDTTLSPGGLATVAVPYAGKLAQGVGGASALGKIGTGATYFNKALGGATAAHGLGGGYEAIVNPSGQGFLEDIKGPAAEMLLGTLGAVSKRPGDPRPGIAAKKFRGSVVQSTAKDAEVVPQRALPPPRDRIFYGDESGRVSSHLGDIDSAVDGDIIDSYVVPQRAIPGRQQRALPPAGARFSAGRGGVRDTRNPFVVEQTVDVSPSGTGRPRPQTLSEVASGYSTPAGDRFKLESLNPVSEYIRSLGRKTREKLLSGLEGRQRLGGELADIVEDVAPASPEGVPYSSTPTAKKTRFKTGKTVDKSLIESTKAGAKEKSIRDMLEESLSARGSTKKTTKKSTKKGGTTLSMFGGGQASEMSRIAKETLEELRDLDYSGLSSRFSEGTGKVKSAIGSARQKALSNIEAAEQQGIFGKGTPVVNKLRKGATAASGPDVTDASLASFYRSGWGYLEGMGEPGKKLSRLIKRARTDANIDAAEAAEKGIPLVDPDNPLDPINRTGGLVWDRHKDEIKSLINQIENPEQRKQADQIIKKYTGQIPQSESAFNRGTEAIRGIQGLTKLSQFGIANPAGVIPAMMRGKLSSVAKNVKRVLPKIGDFEQAAKEAAPSGSLSNVPGSLMSDSGKGGLSKIADQLYRISGSEKRMRTMATLVGRDTAEDLFQKLKANPANKRLARRLDDLLLEDVDTVIKQDKLSDRQLARAGGRMNELTQGIAESIDLPPQWTSGAIADLMTQFKKYSYTQTRNMLAAGKLDPLKTLGVGAVAAPIVGEAIGDVKATIKGAVKAGMSDDEHKDLIDHIVSEIKARGSGGERYGSNLGQSWALGLFGDAIKGAERGNAGLTETIAGPTIGDLGEFAFGVHELVDKGQDYRIRRQLARMIPLVGTGVAANIKGSRVGVKQRRKPGARAKKFSSSGF